MTTTKREAIDMSATAIARRLEQVRALSAQMTRIAVRPTWVGLLDFQTRFPSAIEAAMAGA